MEPTALSDPFAAFYLETAVQRLISSLGIRRGKEEAFVQLIRNSIEKRHICLRWAREVSTDEALSKTFISQHGRAVWGNKEIVNIDHKVDWSRFAGLADTL
jgi:hypothetical protein